MSFFVAPDADDVPTIWQRFLYRDDELVVRQCDLPAENRGSIWQALIRGYECER